MQKKGNIYVWNFALNDNAPVPSARVAKAAIQECGFQKTNPLSYSPDMISSNYYLKKKTEKDICGKRFSDDKDLKTAKKRSFSEVYQSYFLEGTEKIISRCKKCIEVPVNCIEK